ncbi:hypothetical protein [Yoonia sp. 208BN28-4]|uniref:hypothetical protein n=1 Tax=Yoonia sp. 208BN28-4 TaxID=3126505 RepID=UPI00309BA7D5
MPWRWIIGAVLLLAMPAAYLGLRLGQPVSETEAITFFATQYTNTTGRPASDCSAIPSQRDDVWIEVICIGPDLTGYNYLVGARGQQVAVIEMKAPQS